MRIRPIVVVAAIAATSAVVVAGSNIADTRKFVWAENVGWLNWRDANGGTDGAKVFRDSHLAGFVWGENIGWINLGDGNAPYANTDGTNFGVNIDPGSGEMSGYAWGENVGWINFGPFVGGSTAPQATWDNANHRATGYAWGENIGWINLDDAVRLICQIPGDVNEDGEVNVFDFNAVTGNFGAVGEECFENGDADGDGDVDIFDFNAMTGTFGVVCP